MAAAFTLFFLLVAEFLSLALVGVDVYLWREWYLNKDGLNQEYATTCLIGALALLAYLAFGGRIIIRLLISRRRGDEENPKLWRSNNRDELRRPDGSIINIEHYGEKGRQAIVCIHGWNSNSKQWYYQKKHFSRNFHLILIDLPGLGKSKGPTNNDFSLENLAAVLRDVLEKTKPLNPILWGHSIGGMTILTFCKIYKEKLGGISAIILEHTTYTNPLKTAILSSILRRIEYSVLRPLCRLVIVLAPIIWACRWLNYANGSLLAMTRFLVFAGSQSPAQLDFTNLLAASCHPAVTARGMVAMFDYDAAEVLKYIEVPTLVIAADTDRLTKAEASVFIHQELPNAKLITLNAAGHMGLMEQHEMVNQEVSNFLSGNEGGNS